MEVSNGSDSDRVSIWATVEFAETITRSLPLPVPTSSLNLSHEGGCLFSILGTRAQDSLSNPPASLTRRHRQRGGAKEMFANLIESQSHAREFKRRGRFLIATATAYSVLFFVAGIVSIYAYDARVEAQTDELEVLNWIPPMAPVTPQPPHDVQPIRRPAASNAPVDPNIRVAERTEIVSVPDPRSIPSAIGVGPVAPPALGPVRLTDR